MNKVTVYKADNGFVVERETPHKVMVAKTSYDVGNVVEELFIEEVGNE